MTNKTQTYTTSPVPESVRVDPQSVASEYMISLLPKGAPRPVFSTMALMHGKNASGAKALREGFAWNSQMDLLWALGYPEVLLIVDGFPNKETPDTLLDYWIPRRDTDYRWWFRQSELHHPMVLSRRGVFAVLNELETMRNPFTLSLNEFMVATEPHEILAAEARERLLAIAAKGWRDIGLRRAAFVLEALVGPDCVVDTLCEIIENDKFDKQVRQALLWLLPPMRRRLSESGVKILNSRLKMFGESNHTIDKSTVEFIVDPMADVRRDLEDGKDVAALIALDWLDEPQEVVAKCHTKAMKQKPSEPSVRTVFPGGESVIKSEAAYFSKYNRNYSIPAFANFYSTIKHPSIAEMALRASVDKELKKKLPVWFAAHTAHFLPALVSLVKNKEVKLANAASDAQKWMSVVKPGTKSAKTVAKTLKSNPGQLQKVAMEKFVKELPAAFSNLSKVRALVKQVIHEVDPEMATKVVMQELERQLPAAFPSQKKVTALVKKALTITRIIAEETGSAWREESFVAWWSEFPFKLKTTNEQYELLSNAYNELVVG